MLLVATHSLYSHDLFIYPETSSTSRDNPPVLHAGQPIHLPNESLPPRETFRNVGPKYITYCFKKSLKPWFRIGSIQFGVPRMYLMLYWLHIPTFRFVVTQKPIWNPYETHMKPIWNPYEIHMKPIFFMVKPWLNHVNLPYRLRQEIGHGLCWEAAGGQDVPPWSGSMGAPHVRHPNNRPKQYHITRFTYLSEEWKHWLYAAILTLGF